MTVHTDLLRAVAEKPQGNAGRSVPARELGRGAPRAVPAAALLVGAVAAVDHAVAQVPLVQANPVAASVTEEGELCMSRAWLPPE